MAGKDPPPAPSLKQKKYQSFLLPTHLTNFSRKVQSKIIKNKSFRPLRNWAEGTPRLNWSRIGWCNNGLRQRILTQGSGCGSVGRAVASNARGPRFESSHWQTFILNIYCQLHWKDENKEKETGIGQLKKLFKALQKWPVWPDLAKLCPFGKSLQAFGKHLTVYFLFSKMLRLFWQFCDIIRLIFIVSNALIF